MNREIYLSLLNKHKEDDTLDIKTAKQLANSIFDQHDKETLEAAIKYAELVEKYEDNVNRYCEVADKYEKLVDEVVSLKSRTCESCKHYIAVPKSEFHFCSKDVDLEDGWIEKDFSCNRWEKSCQ